MIDKADLSVSYEGERRQNSTVDGEYAVVGTPYHATEEQLIDRYRDSREDFLASERTQSCGNYLLIDASGDRVTVVTSTAYSGGHLVDCGEELHITDTLSEAVSKVPPAELSVDLNRYRSYVARHLEERPPLSTVFEQVSRIPPGVVVTGNGHGWEMQTYISGEGSPESFEEAKGMLLDALADREVILCLSGGADSTALGCFLNESEISFRAVTFDFGPGYDPAPVAGRRMAEQLGFDHDVVDSPRPLDEGSAERIEELMSQDIVPPYSPTYYVSESYADEEEVFIYGQNADNLSMLKMRNQRTYQSLSEQSVSQMFGSLARFGVNLPFTRNYTENELFRRLYLLLAPRLYRLGRRVRGDDFPEKKYNPRNYHYSEKYSTDPDEAGIFTGLLTSGRPNYVGSELRFNSDVVSEATITELDSSFDIDFIREEIERFLRIDAGTNTYETIRRLMYIMNGQNTLAHLSKFPASTGSPVEAPFSWGPSVSYFLSNENRMDRARHPKKEIYDETRSALNQPYHESIGSLPDRSWSESKRSTLLKRNERLVDPSRSVLLNELGVDSRSIEKLYREVFEAADSPVFTSYPDVYMPIRVLNIELVLSRAYLDI
ncbi:asparagine synthase-related protein [Halobaculum sp. MBLA0147]|uniref:asparagine synthase-related protein n=1 Tax=Halobaculum sp. MBLA0147 TaxID=3079934 RepID=UPI00352593D5